MRLKPKKMSNVLETLSLNELNEREINLLQQIKKVKEEKIKRNNELQGIINEEEEIKEKKVRIKIRK